MILFFLLSQIFSLFDFKLLFWIWIVITCSYGYFIHFYFIICYMLPDQYHHFPLYILLLQHTHSYSHSHSSVFCFWTLQLLRKMSNIWDGYYLLFSSSSSINSYISLLMHFSFFFLLMLIMWTCFYFMLMFMMFIMFMFIFILT